MGRRKRTGFAEDVIDLVVLMPWWAGLLLAAIFYVVLHAWAATPMAPAAGPGGVVAMMIRGLATVGQFALPLLCIAGAAASAWQRHEQRQLAQTVTRSPSADALNAMTWQQFERLVGEAFRLEGYRVIETGGGGADGGVDLVLSKGGEKSLVQCKQWRALKVGVDVVRELYGAIAATGAASGFVVTSGDYTAEARAFASGRNVKLIGGDALHRMLREAQRGQAAVGSREDPNIGAEVPTQGTNAPMCPRCGKVMKRRVAKQGATAGQAFWGCSGYPGCKGTRNISLG